MIIEDFIGSQQHPHHFTIMISRFRIKGNQKKTNQLADKQVPGLFCPRCGKKSNTVKVKERFFKQLDLHYFQCLNCEARWYEPDQVIAIIATLKDQVINK